MQLYFPADVTVKVGELVPDSNTPFLYQAYEEAPAVAVSTVDSPAQILKVPVIFRVQFKYSKPL